MRRRIVAPTAARFIAAIKSAEDGFEHTGVYGHRCISQAGNAMLGAFEDELGCAATGAA
ncbi:hypothetical protein [Edaphobacter flagellatus]|uniref:hypothetical protein n=1 Tax=Edaphobacter flagellatus TaxID=1933044 RepID=UPI0021B32641|nr:hypothetical protein [Edaphobacter flagellatus]